MKKIILFSLLIFTTIPGFTYDYREILFGNNYENIIWIYLYKVIDSFNEKSTAVTLKDKNLEPQIINWIDYGFYVKEFYKIYDPAFIKPLCIHNIFFKKIDRVFKILFVRSAFV